MFLIKYQINNTIQTLDYLTSKLMWHAKVVLILFYSPLPPFSLPDQGHGTQGILSPFALLG